MQFASVNHNIKNYFDFNKTSHFNYYVFPDFNLLNALRLHENLIILLFDFNITVFYTVDLYSLYMYINAYSCFTEPGM